MNSTSPADFLDSFDAFSQFHKKAKFAANRCLFLKGEYTEEERSLLQTLKDLPNTSSAYEENMRKIRASGHADRLEKLIAKIMRIAPHPALLPPATTSALNEVALPHPERNEISKEGGEESEQLPLLPQEPVKGQGDELPLFDLLVEDRKSSGESLLEEPEISVSFLAPPSRTSSMPSSSSLPNQPPAIQSGPKHRAIALSRSPLDDLKNRSYFRTCAQGAIIMKFLFPKLYNQHFSKEQRVVIDKLIAAYGLERFKVRNLESALNEAFDEEPAELSSVLARLSDPHFLRTYGGAIPSYKSFKPIPPYFPTAFGPSPEDLLWQMGRFRYQFSGLCTTLQPEFFRCLKCLCAAQYIQDTLEWPLWSCVSAAFNGKYPKESTLSAFVESMQKYVCSDALDPSGGIGSSDSQGAEMSVDDLYDFPYLKYPFLFDLYVSHLKQIENKTQGCVYIKQVQAMRRLKEECLASHEAALKSAFNSMVLSTLSSSLTGESDRVNRALQELKRFVPPFHCDHSALTSRKGISHLRDKTQGELRHCFAEVEDLLELHLDLDPIYAVRAVFTPEKLKELFGCERTSQNAQALTRVIELSLA